MACRASYDIIVLRSVHAGFSSSYYFLAIFDEDAFRRFMSELTANQIIDTGGCSRNGLGFTDTSCLLIIDVGEPVLDELRAIAAVGVVDPKVLAEVISVRDESLAIVDYTTNTAAGTRHNQSDVFLGHVRSSAEQVGLHNGSHLAPP